MQLQTGDVKPAEIPFEQRLSIDAIFFSLGLVDVERALIKALADSGVIDLEAAKSRSLGTEAEVQRSVAERPFEINIHSQLFVPCGTLFVVSSLCAVLIGQGVLNADDLIPVFKQRSELWRSRGSEYRALPAEILHDALKKMAAEKRDVDLTIAASRHIARSRMEQ
jgi:hypothetical protein